ncbi:MAG: hypothetical protein LBP76_09145 [Treponema sp.]|jgi:uncharacterized protein YoxC|nr:hypothetical protein [Treponema sp.]
MAMKVDTTITIGNILSAIGMLAAIVVFLISINIITNENREDLKEIRQSMREMHTTLNAIDKRTAVLEERTNRGSVFW